jgi:hypothetical protein
MSRLGPLGWQWPRNEGSTLLGWSPSGRELRNYPIADILATPHAHTIADVTGLQAALDAKVTDAFLQAGTGAVTRTLQSKLRDVVSLRDFGAVGDGVADDTLAIANWLAFIRTNSRIGFVPEGTYRFTSAINAGIGSNWGIAGAGSGSVIFLYAGANTTNDIMTFGDGVAELVNVRLSGFKLRSNTVMTAGIGLHMRRLCRSSVHDVVPDGQDGNGRLWHGIRFNGADQVHYSNFETRAQRDGLQINGTVGSGPKAGLFLDDYKINTSDVGVRVGGAFGGVYFGKGDIIAVGDGVIIDTSLAAEANREVFFSDQQSIDSASRCGVIIDQATPGGLWVNFPAKMWIASTGSHGIWIKNAPGARIAIDAYLYLIGGDGVRLDDAAATVTVNGVFTNVTGFGVNPTVATTALLYGADLTFLGVSSPVNEAFTRARINLPFPVSIQGSRPILWDTFTGTLNGSGNIIFAHGKGGDYRRQVMQVFGSAQTAGGAWVPLTVAYIDGSDISLTGGAGVASRPYNVMVLVSQTVHPGW